MKKILAIFVVTTICSIAFVPNVLALKEIEGECYLIKPKDYDWEKDFLNFDLSNFGAPAAPPSGSPAQNNILWAIKEWISFGKKPGDTANIIVWWENPPGTWNSAVWDVPPIPPHGNTVDGTVASEAPVHGPGNRNEGSDYVMAPGQAYKIKEHPDWKKNKEKLCKNGPWLKARSWHSDEKEMMTEKYGASFFKTVHAFLTSPWPGAAIDVRILWDNHADAEKELEEEKESKQKFEEGVTWQWSEVDPATKRRKKVRAKVMLASDPNGPGAVPDYFYARDIDGDEWITNADQLHDPVPAGQSDFYSLIKHELGHVFSIEHEKREHRPPWRYFPPINLSYLANSESPDEGPTEAVGSGKYSRVLTVYFSSNRPGGLGGYDIWSIHWDGTKWYNAQNLGATINSSANERDPFVAIDGSLFFSSDRVGGYGGHDLYMVTMDPDLHSWSTPVNLGAAVNSSSDEFDPALPADVSKLYFSSDRSGGQGAFDIWNSSWDESTGKWGLVSNPGSAINTTFNETGPSINMGDTLYFSSDRPGGLGGYDIWRTTFGFMALENIYVLNSPYDEIDPRKTSNDAYFYFSSNRPGGHGDFDLYESRWVEVVPDGTNTYWLALLGLLAMVVGFVVIRKARILRV